MKIPLQARKAFDFHGRSLVAGESFTATPIEALALRYQGRARFAPKDAESSETPMPVVQPEVLTPKRRYRRRDMQAEE